jgi:hypothetical protein
MPITLGDKALDGLWVAFREQVGRLSVREKMRPAHWQRSLGIFFSMVQGAFCGGSNPAVVERVISEMMESSRPWCNPEIGVDDTQARAALRRAVDTILVGPVSAFTDVESEDDVESSGVDMQDKTAQLVAELGL